MSTFNFALLAGYLTVLSVFAFVDFIWLGVIAMPWYQQGFSSLLRESLVLWPWLVFYPTYAAGVLWLAVKPYLDAPIRHSAVAGCILGCTAYGTFNLTGYSIIAGWPLDIALVDWVWGSVATTTMASAGAWVSKLVLYRQQLAA